jgi:hypothetical protein
MAVIYIDPSALVTGSGTFGDPFRSWSSVTWTAGNFYLQKEGTTFNGSVTIGATGTAGNIITLGTYDASTAAQITADKKRQAKIAPNSDTDAVYGTGRDYITVINLDVVCGGGFPNASVRLVNGSNLIVENNTCSVRSGRTGSYGIRLDNATGSGLSCTNWTVRGNLITSTGGNSPIICIRSSTAGEGLSNVIVENNTISNCLNAGGGSTHGIWVSSRAASVSVDRPGLSVFGVQIKNNIIDGIAGYGILASAISAGTSFYNTIENNFVRNVGTGALDIHCIGLQGVQDCIVANNVVDKSYALRGGQTGTGVGIFIDQGPVTSEDGCDRVRVFGNKISNTGIGSSPNIEVGGAAIFVLASRQIEVFSNYMENCPNGVVVQGGFPLTHGSQNVLVQNNTAVNMSRYAYITFGEADLTTMRNNIATNSNNGFYLQTSGGAATNYTELNNIAYNCALPFSSGDVPNTSLPGARTPDGSNVTSNPQLVSNGVPITGSAALTGGAALGWRRDVDGILGKNYRGAYSTPSVATERGVR